MIYYTDVSTHSNLQALQRPVRLVQISDSHLFKDPQRTLLGLNTEHSFLSVLDLVLQEQPHIDLLLTTGDIAQQPDTETYQRYMAHTSRIHAPHFCVQGNHDLDQPFQQSVTPNQLPCEVVIGNWCCLLLDSSVDHEIAGSFSPVTLQYIESALQRQHSKHVLIALHHNPIAVGSAWLDQHMLKDSQPFLALIQQYPNVKLVIHGHVHQAFSATLGNIQFLACPSTSLQFKPNSHSFEIDHVNPGYRWFDLFPDGSVQTDLSRTSHSVNQNIEYASQGY